MRQRREGKSQRGTRKVEAATTWRRKITVGPGPTSKEEQSSATTRQGQQLSYKITARLQDTLANLPPPPAKEKAQAPSEKTSPGPPRGTQEDQQEAGAKRQRATNSNHCRWFLLVRGVFHDCAFCRCRSIRFCFLPCVNFLPCGAFPVSLLRGAVAVSSSILGFVLSRSIRVIRARQS